MRAAGTSVLVVAGLIPRYQQAGPHSPPSCKVLHFSLLPEVPSLQRHPSSLHLAIPGTDRTEEIRGLGTWVQDALPLPRGAGVQS